MTRVEYHRQKYNTAKAEHEHKQKYSIETNGKKMSLIRDNLKHFGIRCEKYNYTLDEAAACPGATKAMMYLSLDE